MGYWQEDKNILAGRDERNKGTWLGINKKTFNFILLTNIEDEYLSLKYEILNKKSRGLLLNIFL